MKLLDLAKTIGSGLVSEFVPGGDLLIKTVNAFLTDDQKLPDNATGDDLKKLPPEILDREFDIRLEELQQRGDTLRTMLEMEQKSTHTTRPKIALGAFRLVVAITLMQAVAWFWAVVTGREALVKAIMDGWPFIAAMNAPFIGWLNAYFGTLRKEQRERLGAVTNRPTRLTEVLRHVFRKNS